MTTEAQRRASAEFVKRRREQGWRKVTVWVSPSDVAKLAAGATLQAVFASPSLALLAAKLAGTSKPAVAYGSRLKKR